MYGLKQSSRVWNKKLDAALKKFGFNQSKLDPCVYFLFEKSNVLIVTIYVDDFIIFSNNLAMKENFKSYLNQVFKMKDMGSAQYCLGIKIDRYIKKGKLFLSQKQYILDVLSKFEMTECKPVQRPMEIGLKLTKTQSSQSEEEKEYMKTVPYRELVGCLMYLAQITRPDIYHVVHKLSQYNTNPSKTHWLCAKRVLRYLKGTMDYKLTYVAEGNQSIIGYCDADWGGCVETGRSTSGYVFTLMGGPMSWSSKKQTCVSISSCESEYVALAHANQEAQWWYMIQEELDLKNIIKMHVDNQSAISLASENFYHAKTKHINIKYHFVRQSVVEGTIQIEYIPTEAQAADMLTKVLPIVKLRNNLKMLAISN